MTRITEVVARDIRFPTSLTLDGSDAMNPSPDYSAAYVILRTNRADGLEGHGLTFTTGRGTEICVAAINALAPYFVDADVDEIFGAMAPFWRRVVSDGQLRWLGPEKGVIHLATGAIINAIWDLRAKCERKPLWKLLVDLTPEQIVGSIDFRYLTDVLTPG
jgi:L-fuconate dehydratase